VNVPQRMQKILSGFFQQEKKITAKIIAERKYIPLDRLYLVPQCSLVIKLSLKTSP